MNLNELKQWADLLDKYTTELRQALTLAEAQLRGTWEKIDELEQQSNSDEQLVLHPVR